MNIAGGSQEEVGYLGGLMLLSYEAYIDTSHSMHKLMYRIINSSVAE